MKLNFVNFQAKLVMHLIFASKNFGKYENSLSTLTFYKPPLLPWLTFVDISQTPPPPWLSTQFVNDPSTDNALVYYYPGKIKEVQS